MWWGILIGFLGLGVGFLSVKGKWLQDGKIQEHERQKEYAAMITREIAKKDKAIQKKAAQKMTRIRRTVRIRLAKPKKTLRDARKLLSRTKEAWPPKA